MTGALTGGMILPGAAIRRQTARALAASFLVGLTFVAFAFVTTQVRFFRSQSPWQEDPYDAVVTFTIFFVSALLSLGLVRGQLCRRREPLPAARLGGLLRAAQVTMGLIGVTVIADWTAVALRADRVAWGGRTPLLVVALVVLSVGTALSASSVAVMTHRLGGVTDEWVNDLIPLGRLLGKSFPGAEAFVLALERCIDTRLRRRPFAAAGGISIGSGFFVAAALALRESGWGLLVPIETAVFAGGVFTFLVFVNRTLNLIHVSTPAQRSRRAARIAATAGALALPLSLGLRDQLWQVTTTVQLAELVALAGVAGAAATFVVAFAALRPAPPEELSVDKVT